MFRGSVKGTGYPSHSLVSPSLPFPSVTVRHHISTGVYHVICCWYPVYFVHASVANYVHCLIRYLLVYFISIFSPTCFALIKPSPWRHIKPKHVVRRNKYVFLCTFLVVDSTLSNARTISVTSNYNPRDANCFLYVISDFRHDANEIFSLLGLLDPWRKDRSFVPKRQNIITTLGSVDSQSSADLNCCHSVTHSLTTEMLLSLTIILKLCVI